MQITFRPPTFTCSQMTEPENGKCEFSVSSKLIDMHIISLCAWKKHILHGRYADLTFLFKIMDFLLKNPNRHCTCPALSITSQAHGKT